MSTWRRFQSRAAPAKESAPPPSDPPAEAAPVPDAASINRDLDAMRDAEVRRLQRSLPGLRRRIKELDARIEACEGLRHRRREALDAREERDELQLRLATVESGQAQAAVRDRVGRYRVDGTQDAGELRTTAEAIATDLGGADPVLIPMGDETCPACDVPMRRLAVESLLACDRCGHSETYLDTNFNAHGHDKVESQSFSYKRANHFIEWLNSAQGREQTTIPDTVLQDCCRQIRTEDIPTDKVNAKVVRRILKVLGHRKYYENSALICYKLTGRRPMRFTAAQEEALKAMFLSIQEPFEQVRPPERRNFLSYSYCLFKFCELLGLDHFLTHFSLLKGRDKLYKQDVIFQKICKILDWDFYPSV